MDQRWQARRHLYVYLEVLDLSSGLPLGRLVDIHKDGMLLVSSVPLKPGRQADVGIRIPEPLGDGLPDPRGSIVIRWSRREGPGEQYLNGCSFDCNDPNDRTRIEALVKRLGFSDGCRKIVLQNGDNVFTDVDEGERA